MNSVIALPAMGIRPAAIFNPTHKQHGAPDASDRHAGDLGNIEADASGKAHLEWSDKVMKFSGADSIVGHEMIVHERSMI